MAFNLFGALMPRQESFTALFCEQVKWIVAAADALRQMCAAGDQVAAHLAGIRDIEMAADAVAKRVFTAANRTFNAPIDREDIYAMASRLDDVLDLIDEVADRFLVYKIDSPTDGAIAMAKIIVKAAEETDRAVRCLRTLSPFYHKHAVEVNRLENEADHLLRDQLAALFEGAKDAIEVIKWKELYETMEAVTDRCEDVVNVIEGIVLKMA